MKPSLRRVRNKDEAFILVTALILISAMVIIALSILSTARLQSSVTQYNYQNIRGELATTPKLVPKIAFEHGETTNDYVVLRAEDASGSDYFYTARYVGNQWEYLPLFSGGEIPAPTTELELPDPAIKPYSDIADIAGQQIAAESTIRVPQAVYGNPRIGWEKITPDPGTLPDDSGLGNAEIYFTYWIEDLSGRVDADVAGNSRAEASGSDVREEFTKTDGFHYRGEGADATEIALFTLFEPGLVTDGPEGTNDADNLLQVIRGSEGVLTEPFVNTILSSAQSGESDFEPPSPDDWNGDESTPGVKDHLSFGTPSWRPMIDYVPERPGFVHLDGNGERIPKLALNPLIRRAESSFDEREIVIRQIAEHIRTCLPAFAETRRGGISSLYADVPFSRDGGGGYDYTDEYLYTLAANIIDYADRDLTPSVGWEPEWDVPVDQQTWEASRSKNPTGGETIPGSFGNRGWDKGDVIPPLYRGIDGQPFLIGLTNQLEYDYEKSREQSRGGSPTVVVDVSTLIVVWNPFDFPISGKLRARLTEGWTTVKWGRDRPRLPHLNLGDPVAYVTLQPNEFRTIPWLDHTELTSQGGGSDLPQSITLDDFGFKLFEAGYQIYWCDEELWDGWPDKGYDGSPRVFLADRSRFPDVMNRDYRRPVRRGQWWYFSSGLGDSQHNRNPNPFSSLYSPGNVSRSGRAYIRSSYIDRLYIFGGGAPRSSYGDNLNPSAWGDYFPPFDPNEYNGRMSRNAPITDFLESNQTMEPLKAPLTVKKYPEDYSSFPTSYLAADYPGLPDNREPAAYFEEIPDRNAYTGPGYYESLSELGNIYDPGCWNPRKHGSLSPGRQGLGATLKVGEPEYDNFDQPGTRATDLIELFVLDYPDAEVAELLDPGYVSQFSPVFPSRELRFSRKGRINVNTADREALRALVAGRRVDSIQVSGTNASVLTVHPARTERVGDIFADTLIDNRPYSSHILSSNDFLSAFLADPDNIYDETVTLSRDREAIFDSLTNLTTVSSRTFRVHVSAFVVDNLVQPDDSIFRRLVSRKSRVYDVFLRPDYDAAGNVTGQSIQVFHELD